MKYIPTFALIALLPLTACAPGQVASTVATVNGYEASVQLACKTAEASADAAATTSGNKDVASAAKLAHYACDKESAISALFLSPTSVAWLNTLITTINSGGQIVPPAPIATPLTKSSLPGV